MTDLLETKFRNLVTGEELSLRQIVDREKENNAIASEFAFTARLIDPVTASAMRCRGIPEFMTVYSLRSLFGILQAFCANNVYDFVVSSNADGSITVYAREEQSREARKWLMERGKP